MFLLDDTPTGGVAVFMAPKTGTTSLTEIAKANGVMHNTGHWHAKKREWIADQHEMDWTAIKWRSVVITIRDPRDRLVSLWKHFQNQYKNEDTLKSFMSEQGGMGPFFKWNLCDWYGYLMRRRVLVDFIRMEHFHDDIKKLLGWKQKVHINKTSHGPWQDHEETIKDYGWCEDDLEMFSDLD